MNLAELTYRVMRIPGLNGFPPGEVHQALNEAQTEVLTTCKIPRRYYRDVPTSEPFVLPDEVFDLLGAETQGDRSRTLKILDINAANQRWDYANWENERARRFMNAIIFDRGNPTSTVYPVGIKEDMMRLHVAIRPLEMTEDEHEPFTVLFETEDEGEERISGFQDFHIMLVHYAAFLMFAESDNEQIRERGIMYHNKFQSELKKLFTFTGPRAKAPKPKLVARFPERSLIGIGSLATRFDDEDASE